MSLADTPREVAARSEIVFSCVTDGAAVRSVALGSDGVIAGLKPGCIYADMSTISPDVSRAVAAEFAAKGLAMLDEHVGHGRRLMPPNSGPTALLPRPTPTDDGGPRGGSNA